MKKLLITFLAMFFSFGTLLYAQNKALSLESVTSALSERPNTTGDFTQIKTISSNGRSLKSSGTFIISRLGIMWKTEKPFPSALILTEEAMVQVAANGKKNVMSGKDNQTFSNISSTLSSVFSGDLTGLKKNFDCNFTDLGGGKWQLSLSPKDSTIAAVMNTLLLSGSCPDQGAVLDSLEMAETSGNSIKYEFFNQTYPEELSADEKQNFIIN